MNNLSLNELKVIREGLEYALVSSNRPDTVSAIQKVDEALAKEGWKFERKAFQNEWKRLNKQK